MLVNPTLINFTSEENLYTVTVKNLASLNIWPCIWWENPFCISAGLLRPGLTEMLLEILEILD